MEDINLSLAKEAQKRNMPAITLSSGAIIALSLIHIWIRMQRAIILYIAVLADMNMILIAAHHAVKPDGASLLQRHITDHGLSLIHI